MLFQRTYGRINSSKPRRLCRAATADFWKSEIANSFRYLENSQGRPTEGWGADASDSQGQQKEKGSKGMWIARGSAAAAILTCTCADKVRAENGSNGVSSQLCHGLIGSHSGPRASLPLSLCMARPCSALIGVTPGAAPVSPAEALAKSPPRQRPKEFTRAHFASSHNFIPWFAKSGPSLTAS